MATIRVRDWTKERIEEICEAESHSSHDSVIKTLLKDRKLAQFASKPADGETEEDISEDSVDTAFDDLTVFAELNRAANGVLFLWCPNCGNEIAHFGVENSLSMTVFEMECQRCLTHLDHHTIVGIEIGYPIEERLVEGTLNDDLKACVIDYWDRTLKRLAEGSFEREANDEQLVWKFSQMVQNFGWEWPPDVPVVELEPGETYRNETTGERIEVIESVSDNRNALNSYRVRKCVDSETIEDAETEIMDTGTIMNLVISRSLYIDSGSEET